MRGRLGSLRPRSARWVKQTKLFGPNVSRSKLKQSVTVTVVDVSLS